MLDTKYVIKRSQSSETRLGLEKGTTVSKETAAAQERWVTGERWSPPQGGVQGEGSTGQGGNGFQERGWGHLRRALKSPWVSSPPEGLGEPECQQRPGGLECKNVFGADVISVQTDRD